MYVYDDYDQQLLNFGDEVYRKTGISIAMGQKELLTYRAGAY